MRARLEDEEGAALELDSAANASASYHKFTAQKVGDFELFSIGVNSEIRYRRESWHAGAWLPQPACSPHRHLARRTGRSCSVSGWAAKRENLAAAAGCSGNAYAIVSNRACRVGRRSQDTWLI